MWNAKSGLVVVFACGLSSGCVTSAVYEESWAEQVKVKSDTCPVIDGVYQNAGETFSKGTNDKLKREELSLAHLVNGGGTLGSHHAGDRLGTTYYKASQDEYRTVSLRLEENKLHVEAALADGTTRKFALPMRLKCHDSLLVFETGWAYDLFAAAIGRGYHALGRAEDGSLLAYRNLTAEALAIFWSSESLWVRFPPATPSPAPEQMSALTP